ncbi:DUF2971 domain-containing protein [Photobacterium leiognathi]|uniref:DUF2971 domain-containing protein n=1 Tax=Photobacterium leiognathi TaxID=553611 RepID=UPI000D17CECE|nr:DUF2971 domain-containing protein [Photobacterium leiognathi]PSW41677.1 hypothetical protein C0W40_18835 [Photobacterium leiognathi subsp. mandapamensis]
MNDNKHPISLFKFRAGNENDLDSLHSDYLWFPYCADLNDPFEGLAYIDNSGISSHLYGEFRKTHEARYKTKSTFDGLNDQEFTLKWFDTYFDTWRKNTSVFSGSKNYQYPPPPEQEHVLGSMALWGHYADGLRGYCIEYNFQQLIESLVENSHDEKIGSCDVHYSKAKRPTIDLKQHIDDFISGDKRASIQNIQQAFATKHEGTWLHEQEVRLFATKAGKFNFNPSCIKAVYIGEKMPIWKKKSIEACLKAKEEHIILHEVSIDPFSKNYQLRIKEYKG